MVALERLLRELRPRLVWVSASYLPDPQGFARAYAEFYRAAERQGLEVFCGAKKIKMEVPWGELPEGKRKLVQE